MAHVYKCNWCGALIDHEAAHKGESEFREISFRKMSEQWDMPRASDIWHGCGDCVKRIKAAIKPL